MSKKKSPLEKRTQNKRHLIDHIPCCLKKPRTQVSLRRRTDFSSMTLSRNPSCKGLLIESLNRVDRLTTHTGMRKRRDSIKEHIMFTLGACNSSPDIRGQLFSDGVESIGQNSLFKASSGRNFDKRNGDGMGNSELISEKSQVENTGDFVATGNVVWAKSASQHWWPAEALHKREHQSSSKQFSGLSGDYSVSNHGYQTPEKCNFSTSSRTESPCDETRKSKRERKRKIHFDEEPLPLILARGVRRTRIMRSLGLAAPVGSPFEMLTCRKRFDFSDLL